MTEATQSTWIVTRFPNPGSVQGFQDLQQFNNRQDAESWRNQNAPDAEITEATAISIL